MYNSQGSEKLMIISVKLLLHISNEQNLTAGKLVPKYLFSIIPLWKPNERAKPDDCYSWNYKINCCFTPLQETIIYSLFHQHPFFSSSIGFFSTLEALLILFISQFATFARKWAKNLSQLDSCNFSIDALCSAAWADPSMPKFFRFSRNASSSNGFIL